MITYVGSSLVSISGMDTTRGKGRDLSVTTESNHLPKYFSFILSSIIISIMDIDGK